MRPPDASRPELTRRGFLRRVGCISLAALMGGCGVESVVEPGKLQVYRTRVTIPALPKAFSGLRIAQLTDIHHGPTVALEHIERAVSMANELSPDIVALTGDYVYHGTRYIAPCFEALAKLRARLGLFGVLGNHDHWHDAEKAREAMRQSGIVDLTNTNRRIGLVGQSLWLAGVGDLWEGTQDLNSALRGVPSEGVAILLSHNPDYNEEMNDRRVKLMLAGHTHGGQVNLPLFGPPVLPSKFGHKYEAGLVRDDWKQVYISRGVGSITPAIRFRCIPEVTLLELG